MFSPLHFISKQSSRIVRIMYFRPYPSIYTRHNCMPAPECTKVERTQHSQHAPQQYVGIDLWEAFASSRPALFWWRASVFDAGPSSEKRWAYAMLRFTTYMEDQFDGRYSIKTRARSRGNLQKWRGCLLLFISLVHPFRGARPKLQLLMGIISVQSHSVQHLQISMLKDTFRSQFNRLRQRINTTRAYSRA